MIGVNRLAAFVMAMLFVLIPFLASFGVAYHRYQMQKQVHEMAENISLERIVLKKVDFPNIKSGCEITWNGNKYDVKSIEIQNEWVMVLAVNDKLEKQIENIIDKDFGGQLPKSKNNKFVDSDIVDLHGLQVTHFFIVENIYNLENLNYLDPNFVDVFQPPRV